jgi:hypothetical protein
VSPYPDLRRVPVVAGRSGEGLFTIALQTSVIRDLRPSEAPVTSPALPLIHAQLTTLGSAHHLVDRTASAPGTDEPSRVHSRTVVLAPWVAHKASGIGLDLVAARLTPHDESDAGRSRIAERHRRPRLRFHADSANGRSQFEYLPLPSRIARLLAGEKLLKRNQQNGANAVLFYINASICPYKAPQNIYDLVIC